MSWTKLHCTIFYDIPKDCAVQPKQRVQLHLAMKKQRIMDLDQYLEKMITNTIVI